MNLRSRYLAGPVAVVSAVAGATLLSLSPASATPSAPLAARPAATVSVAAQEAVLARPTTAGSSLCVPGKVVRARHGACAVTTVDYRVIEVPSGKVLGTGTITVGYKETLNAMSRAWKLVAGIELTDATGVVVGDTTATTNIACTGGCTSSEPWARPLVKGTPYTHAFTVSSAGRGTDTTGQAPVVTIVNPDATDQAAPVRLDSLGPARCDSDPLLRQFGKSTSGCVFKDVAASYDVYLTGHGEDQVASNVERGQQAKSLHFGWYGHGRVLFRAPPPVAAKNRQVACGKTTYRKPFSCDEYPFAATYQGAFYFPSQSVTMKVLGTENSTEGGLRSAMYVSERLLYGDSYWVFVVP